jgi:hypothetical protein
MLMQSMQELRLAAAAQMQSMQSMQELRLAAAAQQPHT